MISRLVPALLICTLCLPVLAQSNVPAWNDGPKGATHTYYNRAAKLPWDRPLGDWRDASGRPWGHTPYNYATVSPSDKGQDLAIDSTDLVRQWYRGELTNQGVFLLAEGKMTIAFYSREAGQSPPRLRLKFSDSQHTLEATYDTHLDKSTTRSLGDSDQLKIHSARPALIWFDLSALPRGKFLEQAELQLTVKKTYGSSMTRVNLFRVAPAPDSSKETSSSAGLSGQYVQDRGIEDNPAVYFATGFEQADWQQRWFIDGKSGAGSVQDSGDTDNGFQTLVGNALRATIPQGKNMGLNIRYRFSKDNKPEPDAAYFRYYLRLGDNWNQTLTGGKLPGFSGTYQSAGWGSRRPDGTNGWSARGSFFKTIQPLRKHHIPLTPIGSYVYHLDQNSYYGNKWGWPEGGGAMLETNRWYCIEQYVKLNQPNGRDGEIRAWLDGKQVFERTGLRFRTSSALKIQDAWFNIYHGGSTKSPYEQTAYVDNVVVAKEYIGPMQSPD